MKLIVFAFVLLFAFVQSFSVKASCTQDLEVKCVDDINKGTAFH